MTRGSDRDTPLSVYINGVVVGYVVNSDYGTGTISTSVPVNKNDIVVIRRLRSDLLWFRPFK